MKSAEEWTKEIYELGNLFKPTVEQIWQVQLDAWKQGMTDAANIANKYGSDLNGIAQQVRNEIQHTRNSKTTP